MKVLILEKEIVDHKNGKDDLKKQLKKTKKKHQSTRGSVRQMQGLADESQRGDAEEDGDNLVDASGKDLAAAEEEE